jgi:arylsulfatase A-like enzyme
MTPQIDELAYEGMNFRQAFSEVPVCVPARRMMMTGKGRYGIHMNVNQDGQPFTEGPKLAEVMTDAGYQTFASGKLHTCPQRNRIGFEDVQLNEEGRKQGDLLKDDYEAFLDEHGYGHLAYTHGLGNNEYGVRMSPVPEPFTTTHWTAQRAMEFIDRRDPTRPFFIHLSFDKPHPPITPPESYYRLYEDVDFPEPAMGDWVDEKLPMRIRNLQLRNNYDDWKDHPLMVQQSLRGFAALITHIDSMIGVFLGHLREHGLLDNTLIIFTSDHGDQLFDHGNLAKGDFFRGSTNVPYIVRPPRAWAAAHDFAYSRTDTTTPVGLQDIMPTILDVCGVDIPETVEGQSLVPLLLGEEDAFRDYTCGNCNVVYGVNDGQTKYMWWGDGARADGTVAEDGIEFLFDVQNDPNDLHDLSDDPAWQDALERQRRRLIAWMAANDDPHVEDGELKVIPQDWDPQRARASVVWNNRGRH